LGKTYFFKIALLLLCFILTSILIYRQPESDPIKEKTALSSALSNIDGWETIRSNSIEEAIIESLKLDDYANLSYSKGSAIISLYIGYYYTGGKIGAAHDPLVCFPGQGWVVKDRDQGVYEIDQDISVSYSTMIVEKGQQRQLILYWFQSHDKTSPDTFSQKINSLWKKIKEKEQDSAFVRISITVGDDPLSGYKDNILDFVKSFYPLFLNYIQN
jgi:EpsI family protein